MGWHDETGPGGDWRASRGPRSPGRDLNVSIPHEHRADHDPSPHGPVERHPRWCSSLLCVGGVHRGVGELFVPDESDALISVAPMRADSSRGGRQIVQPMGLELDVLGPGPAYVEGVDVVRLARFLTACLRQR